MFIKTPKITTDFEKSFLAKTGNKFNSLTKLYQNSFELALREGPKNLNKKTKNIFFEWIVEIRSYIALSFEYSLFNNFENKPPHEKVISAIFFRYSSFIGSTRAALDSIKPQLEEIAESAIFYSLNIEHYKNRNYTWNPTDLKYNNFIKHTIKKVFNPLLLDFFKEKEAKLNLMKDYDLNIIEEENNLSAEDLIISSGILIPYDIKKNIIKYLNNDIELETLSKPEMFYLKQIHKKITI